MQAGSRGTRRTTSPVGEDVSVTLQIVIGGSDGVLLGTDTKITSFPFGASPLGELQRRALEVGKIRSADYGAEKILFNDRRTIAVACSGSEVTYPVGKAIVEELETVWGEFSEPINGLCLEKWKALPEDQRREASERVENTVILVHSSKPKVFKIRFRVDDLEIFPSHRSKNQRFIVLGGDSLNPSGLFLERYLPRRPPSINKLATLAAHYILVGGEVNPSGVGGLKMYFSKDNCPFEAMSESVVGELCEKSERLNGRLQKALLQSVVF